MRTAGISFVARPCAVAENPLAGESAERYVRRLALAKAEAASGSGDEIVLSADTTVHMAGNILEKPLDAADAMRMLRLLAGNTHEVLTAICLRRGERAMVDCETTRVRFVEMAEGEIRDYVASGEPVGKAGAYAIQGLGCKFIDRIEGCYFNVVGLPVALLWRRLKEFSKVTL